MPYAETDEEAFQFPRDRQRLSGIVLDAAGTNTKSRLPFHRLLFIICGVNIAAFLRFFEYAMSLAL